MAKWKKNDVLVPRLLKCPDRHTKIVILDILTNEYLIKDEKGIEEKIEHRYLDSGYINDHDMYVNTWTKVGVKDESIKENATSNDRKSIETPREDETDSTISKDSEVGPIRKRSSRAAVSGGSYSSASMCPPSSNGRKSTKKSIRGPRRVRHTKESV